MSLESNIELGDFLTCHSIPKDPSGNSRFFATVTYESKMSTITTQMDVFVQGHSYNSGTIKLTENPDLDVNQFHLDFTPTYQKYTFRKDTEKLVIEGTSNKMGGKYIVTISI